MEKLVHPNRASREGEHFEGIRSVPGSSFERSNLLGIEAMFARQLQGIGISTKQIRKSVFKIHVTLHDNDDSRSAVIRLADDKR